MREFVEGTQKQYDMLEEMLEDCKCHVYYCEFPESCVPRRGRIGFEKEENAYALLIDKGIVYGGSQEGFREWLSLGTLRFMDFDDMVAFLKGLKSLYQ